MRSPLSFQVVNANSLLERRENIKGQVRDSGTFILLTSQIVARSERKLQFSFCISKPRLRVMEEPRDS